MGTQQRSPAMIRPSRTFWRGADPQVLLSSREGVTFAGDGEGGFSIPRFLPAFDAAMLGLVTMLELLAGPDADRPLFHIVAEGNTQRSAKSLAEKYAAIVNGLQR
jgi:hypothetical protein